MTHCTNVNGLKSLQAGFAAAIVAALAVPLVGCGSGKPTMGRVTGKVVYADGTVPTGAAAVIRFEPITGTSAEIRKAASAHIESDGSYELFTIRPGDGVIYGEYKAVFTVLESYRSGKSLIAERFTALESSPFDCVVNDSSHVYNFEVEMAR